LFEYENGDFFTATQNNVLIGTKIRLASKWYARLKGLLGTRGLDSNSGLWLSPCNSIHMLGMIYSIDAIFLDKHYRVCKLVHNLRPFAMSFGGKKAYSVIELPANFLKELDIKIGQPIIISKNEG